MTLGTLSYVPGLHAALRRGTGGTNSARYCYSVWMRHLLRHHRAGLSTAPRTVAELGPGDSLGIGLAALLCGAESYVALDAVPHARTDANLAVFDELVSMLRARAPVPGVDEFPNLSPSIDDCSFPHAVLPDGRLESALEESRVARLRDDVSRLSGSVRYASEWWRAEAVEAASVDLILSQAVLEHVNDLEGTYAAMYQWLRSGGVMSHQIDLKSHETADAWNGHWGYGDWVWRVMRGALPYLLNRVPASGHLAAATAAGFVLVSVERLVRTDGLRRDELAPRFRGMSDEDLATAGVFLQCRK